MDDVIGLEGSPGGHEEWRPQVLSVDQHLVHALGDINEINLIRQLVPHG